MEYCCALSSVNVAPSKRRNGGVLNCALQSRTNSSHMASVLFMPAPIGQYLPAVHRMPKTSLHTFLQRFDSPSFLTHESLRCPTTDSLGPHTPKARLLITTGTKPSPGTTSPISMKSNSDKLTSSIHGMFHLADSMPPTTCPTFETKTNAMGRSSAGSISSARSMPFAISCTAP